MPWTLLLNPRVIGAVVAFLALAGYTVGIYEKGVHTERAKWQVIQAQAEVKAQEQARLTEQQTAANVAEVSKDYEKKIETLHRNYSAWIDTVRLRVPKRTANSLPKAPGTAKRTDAAAAESGSGTGETNLDGIAKSIAAIGKDLDDCSEQVLGLQGLIKTYQGKGK